MRPFFKKIRSSSQRWSPSSCCVVEEALPVTITLDSGTDKGPPRPLGCWRQPARMSIFTSWLHQCQSRVLLTLVIRHRRSCVDAQVRHRDQVTGPGQRAVLGGQRRPTCRHRQDIVKSPSFSSSVTTWRHFATSHWSLRWVWHGEWRRSSI